MTSEHKTAEAAAHSIDTDMPNKENTNASYEQREQENSPPALIMSDDANRVFEPPAHIAARFYRKPLTRRKSSATSSRRNSLSSTHSHTSSRSLRRPSSHSHAIAQQLRRASILETRKARLADRAAHCEQVRLRAALLKAAPQRSTASEERAVAAQLAREKYLAKVAAQCAEEVERAKQRAQEIKAKKLEEERKTRQDMEDRLAEADRRRAEYQRNLHARRIRRASSQEKKLAPVAEDIDVEKTGAAILIDEDTAARRIQRTWRYKLRKAVVEAWVDVGINLEHMRLISFEDVSSLVINEKIITATQRILALFGLRSPGQDACNSETRAFLSAYLLLAHPDSVFGKLGAQENDLVSKAQELVLLFEMATCRLARWNRFSPNPTQVEELSQVYSTYTSTFNAWKAQDSSTLIDTMVASFVELDAIWQTVKDDTIEHVAEDYRQGIRDNQVILLSRIRKLAGPDRADVLIKKAIRESRRRKGRKRTAAEVRPRVAETAVANTEAIPSNDAALEGVRQLSSAATEPSTAGPKSFSALFSPIPSNRIITHELAINKDYRVPTAKQSELRDQINRGLCDSMKAGIERGELAPWTTAMAECIRGKLLGILKPGNSMHTLISEALDSDHVYRQCTQGMFSYAKFFDFMSTILPKLCAPFRDEQVKTLVEDLKTMTDDTSEMIEKLFRLLHFVDLLSLDYSNFLLMNAAPVLIREAAGYEHRSFAQDLEAGRTSLTNTTRWWRNSSVNALTEADRRDPEQVRLAIDRPTPVKIHARGLVELATSSTTLEEQAWPETLALDRDRLLHIRRNYYRIICIGASLLTAKNLMKRDVRAPWKAEATRLWELTSKVGLDAEDLSQQVFSILISSRGMPESSERFLQAAVTRFCQQAASGRLSDPVLKILAQRLRTHVFMRISAATSQERVRAASSASESLASAGLPEFVAHISDIVDIMGRLVDVDYKAHGAWYEQIAQETRDAGDA
ncbi:SOK1-like protein 2 [Elsinoe fawcettii]|nr:SOK1-like protein 2 [Elsinoe fawcettii]